MPSVNTIAPDKLVRLVGTPKCPTLVDVRDAVDVKTNPRSIPTAIWRDPDAPSSWVGEFAGQHTVVICSSGRSVSQGIAAMLRHAGATADILEGGHQAWSKAELPLVDRTKLPPRDACGRTVWVTRARPKIDRIACPWLIRRFVDRSAMFLFVAPADVKAVAERFRGAPFDVEDTFWSHREERCTFDILIAELGLATVPLERLATIIRAADTARLDLAPEAAGLLAASLGLSRLYADDLEQLEAGIALYDAFYRWCRDATDETHDWPTTRGA